MRCPHCNSILKRRPDIVIEHEGQPMSLVEVATRVGIPYSTLSRRYRKGERDSVLLRAPDPKKSWRGRDA